MRDKLKIGMMVGCVFIAVGILVLVGVMLANPPGVSTSATTKDRTQLPGLEIVDLAMKPVEVDRLLGMVSISWRFDVVNRTGQSQMCNFKVHWLDSDGFLVAEGYADLVTVPANGKASESGITPMSLTTWESAKTMRVEFR